MNQPYFPPLVIESLSCFEVIRMSSENDRTGLTEYLLAGIVVAIPEAADRAYIADHILNEMELGIMQEETAQAFIEIAEKMAREQEIEALVLGCTELPLLFNNRTPSIPTLDTMQLHIQALVNTVFED